MSRLVYTKPFFELQLDFARTVSGLSGLPYGRALLAYTNLYVRFGLGQEPDEAHPGWQDFLRGLPREGDPAAWTHRFYLERSRARVTLPIVASSGCFAYARPRPDRIRLHFQNVEPDGHSPLGRDRRPRRFAELRALFAHVTRTVPEPVAVVGASWLYNLEAYRCLFPPSYVHGAQVMRGRFQRMPLWGQFLDRHGELRASAARVFRERLTALTGVEGLEQCFPLPVLAVTAPVTDFSAFYGGGGDPRLPH
jgi:hypothetical protein